MGMPRTTGSKACPVLCYSRQEAGRWQKHLLHPLRMTTAGRPCPRPEEDGLRGALLTGGLRVSTWRERRVFHSCSFLVALSGKDAGLTRILRP